MQKNINGMDLKNHEDVNGLDKTNLYRQSGQINVIGRLVMVGVPFLILGGLGGVDCGRVEECVMLSIVFWVVCLWDLA